MKTVQNIKRIFKPGQVKNAERACVIAKSDFRHASANLSHHFPVRRFQASLNFVQLIARIFANIFGKST
ncbi:hypothetical protein LG58_3694 [Kosakonia radicincitans YD4]|nr:hypothetical protein LG58_3694 [Kosakonia radicincitans YD4]